MHAVVRYLGGVKKWLPVVELQQQVSEAPATNLMGQRQHSVPPPSVQYLLFLLQQASGL